MQMNKKGQFFSILLVTAVIGLLVYAWGAFNVKHKSFDSEIGEKQLNLIKNYYEAEKAMFYIEQGNRFAIYQALYDLGKKGGYYVEPECGNYDGWVLWSYRKNGCFPDISEVRQGAGSLVKERTNNYLGVKEKKVYQHLMSFFPIQKEKLAEAVMKETPGWFQLKKEQALGLVSNGVWVGILDENFAEFLLGELPKIQDVGDEKVLIIYEGGKKKKNIEIHNVIKYDAESKNYFERPYVIGRGRSSILWNTTEGEKYTIVDVTPGEAAKFIEDSYDFVFTEKEEDFLGESFDYFPLKQIKLENLQSNGEVKEESNKIIEWNVADGISTVYDLVTGKDYKVNINDGRWDGTIEKLEVRGISAVPLLYESSCTVKGCGKYVVRPDTLNKVDYRLSLYDDIVRGAKEINETCSEKENNDILQCVESEISKRGWYLGYCPSFSKREEECMEQTGRVAYLVDGKFKKCDDCPNVYASCDRYINEAYCELDPCNLDCEWALTSCIPKISEEERDCMSVKGRVPYFSRGLFKGVVYDIFGVELSNPDLTDCVKCPSNGKCENYVNEEYCNTDPCDIKCYGELKDGKYDKCAKCDGLLYCSHYTSKKYCELDPCGKDGCVWSGSQCTEITGKIKNNPIDTERTFKICAADSRFFVYDEDLRQSKEIPVGVRFALNIPDVTPPDPIKRLDVRDKDVAEDSVVISWDQNKASDISYYNIYYMEVADDSLAEDYLRQQIEGEIAVENLKNIKVEGREFEESLIEINLDEVKKEKVARYSVNNGITYLELRKNVEYNIEDSKNIVYVLDALLKEKEDNERLKDQKISVDYYDLVDGKKYIFAVTPVDMYDNENKNIEVVSIVEVVDDLGPDVVGLKGPSYSSIDLAGVPLEKIKLTWTLVDKNSDESDMDDFKEYRIYKQEGMCIALQNGLKGDIGDLDILKTTTDTQVEVTNLDLDFSKCYYFGVIGYDDKGNHYYGSETIWRGVNIPGAS